MRAKRAIYWFRADLRLDDNPSLLQAISSSDTLVFAYCHEPDEIPLNWGFQRTGPHRRALLNQAIESLRSALMSQGQVLVECVGLPEIALNHLASEVGTNLIFSEAIEAPFEIESIRKLRDSGLTVTTLWQSSLIDPLDLPFDVGNLPDVFTTFRQRVEQAGVRPPAPLPAPMKLPAQPKGFVWATPRFEAERAVLDADASFPYDLPLFHGGESAGLNHLNRYLEQRLPDTYKKTRNELSGVEFSSKFSPWLAHGALSSRRVYQAVQCYEAQFGGNEGTYWLWFELLWRDYFRFLHLKYGKRLYFASGLAGHTRPQHDEQAFNAWCHGQTGQRFIDAGMRELLLTGYLSNRMRQIVASFLIHDLACDWRAGAAWFERQLIDFDVYSNQGNWLYIAGFGTDPRGGRVFNPEKQAKTYDPSGEYQNRWLSKTPL